MSYLSEGMVPEDQRLKLKEFIKRYSRDLVWLADRIEAGVKQAKSDYKVTVESLMEVKLELFELDLRLADDL